MACPRVLVEIGDRPTYLTAQACELDFGYVFTGSRPGPVVREGGMKVI
jgi:hypothetical protein